MLYSWIVCIRVRVDFVEKISKSNNISDYYLMISPNLQQALMSRAF